MPNIEHRVTSSHLVWMLLSFLLATLIDCLLIKPLPPIVCLPTGLFCIKLQSSFTRPDSSCKHTQQSYRIHVERTVLMALITPQ